MNQQPLPLPQANGGDSISVFYAWMQANKVPVTDLWISEAFQVEEGPPRIWKVAASYNGHLGQGRATQKQAAKHAAVRALIEDMHTGKKKKEKQVKKEKEELAAAAAASAPATQTITAQPTDEEIMNLLERPAVTKTGLSTAFLRSVLNCGSTRALLRQLHRLKEEGKVFRVEADEGMAWFAGKGMVAAAAASSSSSSSSSAPRSNAVPAVAKPVKTEAAAASSWQPVIDLRRELKIEVISRGAEGLDALTMLPAYIYHNRTESEVLGKLKELCQDGVITRVAVNGTDRWYDSHLVHISSV